MNASAISIPHDHGHHGDDHGHHGHVTLQYQPGLPLTRGTHLLRFEAEGYMTETVEVQAQEIMMTVEIRLLTKPAGEAKGKTKK